MCYFTFCSESQVYRLNRAITVNNAFTKIQNGARGYDGFRSDMRESSHILVPHPA
jgi:hypothetical protein